MYNEIINEKDIKLREQIEEKIKTLYTNYDFLNWTSDKFEKVCKDLLEKIYTNNPKTSFKKAIDILQNELDQYVQKKLNDSRNTQKIIKSFIAKKIEIHETAELNLEELRKINNFLIRYEVEENPELYYELLNNPTIHKIVELIVINKINKNNEVEIITLDKNHNVQLLLEMYCENHNISFKNTYHEVKGIDHDVDMQAKTVDSFGLYLTQIARPLLTKEEEQRLFILKEQGDAKAKEKLIEHNLQLVVHIAKSYTGKGLDILDLVQEGNLGLINAIDRFDYKKGYKLSTYATWWIRQSIQRGIMNTVRAVRLPVHVHEKLAKYNFAISKLTAELKREPTRAEICEELKITPAQLNSLEVANQDVVSMNLIVGDKEDSDTFLEDFIVDESDNQQDEWMKSCVIEEIHHIIKQTNLSERERLVIIERNGLKDGKPKTLSEIATYIGVTRERVRQIEAKALRKLRVSPYIKNLATLADIPERQSYTPTRYQRVYNSYPSNNVKTLTKKQ